MLRRGAIRRCPRCGGGRLFRTFWSIRDRCPRCGLRFAREPGYFTGVYLVNFGVVLAVLFVVVMGFALWLGNDPNASLVPPLVIGVAVAVILPIAFYPFARTLWSALDLAMTPMELDEILDAVEATDDDEPGAGSTGSEGPDRHPGGDGEQPSRDR